MDRQGRALLVAVGLSCAAAPAAHASKLPGWPWLHRAPPASTYRIGDTWGKTPISKEDLGREGAVFAQAALAVAAYNNATSFYLGRFAGRHVMATAHHVQRDLKCAGPSVRFPLADVRFACKTVLVTWPEVDLALFTIEVPDEARAFFDGLGHNFAFDASIYPGQPLLTLGFGTADNPDHLLTASRDADCMVFSDRDDFRYMEDPGPPQYSTYQTWSFAHGCDISHGDSGAPIFDRHDGAVLGIVWGGALPKVPAVQDSASLQRIFREKAPQVWNGLGYATPATKVRERIRRALKNTILTEEQRAVLQGVVGD